MERDARHVLSELLVLRAQGGDEGAFAELHALWRADVVRFATSRLGEAAGAEEVAQNAWIAIARGLGRLDDPACFARWALRIVERRAADFVRRQQQLRRDAAALADHALREPENSVAQLAVADDCGRLQEVIAGLDAATRELLSLFYQTGLSVGDIADQLGVPAGTVKSRLYHAREKLRQHLERNAS